MKHVLELVNRETKEVYHTMNCPTYDRLSQMGMDLDMCSGITVDGIRYVRSGGREWVFGHDCIKVQIGVRPFDSDKDRI